jgi:hypothetical protein
MKMHETRVKYGAQSLFSSSCPQSFSCTQLAHLKRELAMHRGAMAVHNYVQDLQHQLDRCVFVFGVCVCLCVRAARFELIVSWSGLFEFA